MLETLNFLNEHKGEIEGLYHDSYYRMGGWNGLVMAINEVKKRYNFKGKIIEKEINQIYKKGDKMNYFLVKADIRDGEAEYAESFIVKAKNLDNAEEIGEKIKDKVLGYNDYREIRMRGIQEITLGEAKIIERLGLSYVAN